MERVIWLTGHSGSGKTTIAKSLQKEMDCIVLDGDEMVECISSDLGLTRADRRERNLRVARLARVLARQKMVVLCVIAGIKDVRKEVDAICSPEWIYVKRTLPEREGHFYEAPDAASLVLDHDVLTTQQSVDRLKKYLMQST